jgi:pheromone a factor receptor
LFVVRRYQFVKLLETSQSALTTSRFLRLIALALTQVAFTLPVVLYVFVQLCKTKPKPYTSWAAVHYDFGFVNQYTAEIWSEYLTAMGTTLAQVNELSFWTPGIGAYLFFVFFGLGDESIAGYRACFNWITTKLGCSARRSTRSARFNHR